MRAEVLQLRLHLPLAPSGIPVLYWDQHWNLWFVPHSSDFQHLLTTGLAFGSGHGNPKVTRRLAHKRKNTFAVPSPTNKMPSLIRQSHHKFTISEGTETLLKHFTYVVKEHYPLKRYFYQTISIHQRELYQQKKCLGLWVTIPLMCRNHPSALSSTESQRVFPHKLAYGMHLAVQ